MAPQKFASVRHGARPTIRLAPFRDDTGLVALRYEHTKQAEPPIPLPPPRNPRRLTRAASTTTTATSIRASPIIINPPPVPPPQEEHPLFRTRPRSQVSSSRSQSDEWKRDSGHAPTSSSATLREECAGDPLYQKILDDIADTPSVYSGDEQAPDQSPTTDDQCAPSPVTVSIPQHAGEDGTVASSPSQAAQPVSPTRPTSLSRKLSGSFASGPDGSKRLRKRMLGNDRAASASQGDEGQGQVQGTPPATVRGSLASPKSPKSPRLHPQSTGPSSANPDREQDLSCSPTAKTFSPINTFIPEGGLWDDLGNLSFSKRGSIIMFGRKKSKASMMSSSDEMASSKEQAASASKSLPITTDNATAPESSARNVGNADAAAEKSRAATHADSPSVPSIRVSSIDIERESQKVRSLYESGDDLNWEDGGRVSFAERLEPTAEVPSEEEENVVSSRPPDPPDPPSSLPRSDRLAAPTLGTVTPRPASSSSPQRDSRIRREYERAGGIEDWDDLEGVEVDRYGFISPKRPASRAGTAELRSSQFSPRRRNVLTKRPATAHSPSSLPGGFMRPPSRKVSARSLNTFTSDLSIVSRRSTRSSIRSATNRLPHNRDRRWMDGAGEMLSLQAGLTGIADDEKVGKDLEAQKRKEAERSEKWRKMATAVRSKEGGQGQVHAQGYGMDYEFDTKNAKLIERTWKGIPDCWRSAAWYSFLASSAKAWQSTETEEHLIAEFKRLQSVASPDDVQIDLDVPRTINGHIMFRRRYRGGQRLLFRVLHAISLYFPEIGYVQGMASLAATLLCYFDEERCFVMLVRLWRYRGLGRLYRPGFAGLMSALEDFEKRWLAGKDVASKLNELSISATAYGTRWYLTLFNLSIPFPAQLRVWDVFMLMGECPPELSEQQAKESSSSNSNHHHDAGPLTPNPKGLDILHATSAALIQALRDVLLDSDFENAMKALTAWIPIRDEDLLMKVTRAEWRRHQGKTKKKKKEKEKKDGKA
ncbi:hypothetical protein VTK56DRAFT_4480 [Thermocarpiscus australiensis]